MCKGTRDPPTIDFDRVWISQLAKDTHDRVSVGDVVYAVAKIEATEGRVLARQVGPLTPDVVMFKGTLSPRQ